MTDASRFLVTGFEPFGAHASNPAGELAKAIDGRHIAGGAVHGLILPVDHRDAAARVAAALEEAPPAAVVHLGLAEGRARVALERVAVNVMDFAIADNTGYRAVDERCVPDGPPAYFSTLPLRAILAALTDEGIPAYISGTAGTFLCNQTLYRTLHAVACAGRPIPVGFVHLPLLPAMVARAGLDQPSMDLGLMLRALEVILHVVATDSRRSA